MHSFVSSSTLQQGILLWAVKCKWDLTPILVLHLQAVPMLGLSLTIARALSGSMLPELASKGTIPC